MYLSFLTIGCFVYHPLQDHPQEPLILDAQPPQAEDFQCPADIPKHPDYCIRAPGMNRYSGSVVYLSECRRPTTWISNSMTCRQVS